MSALQDHIISTHCKTSNTESLLIKILSNQEEQKKLIQQLSLKQTCMKTDLEEIKTSANFQPSVPSSSQATHQLPTMAEVVSRSSTASAEQSQQFEPLQQEASSHESQSCASSILYMGDSIFRNVHSEKLEKETKAKLTIVKAYSSVYNNHKKNKFKASNFADLMPKELENGDHDVVLMQASSTDLTNHRTEKNKERLRQIAQASNSNMLSVAKTAAITHPELKKIVLFERTPRFDELEDLNEYANQDLFSQWQKCDEEFKNKVIVGKHNLKPHGKFAKIQQLARWGDRRLHQNPDYLHLRGSTGCMKTTDSILSVLFRTGLTEAFNPGFFEESKENKRFHQGRSSSSQQPQSWQEAGGRRQGRAPRRRQEQPFQLPLRNSFIQGNC